MCEEFWQRGEYTIGTDPSRLNIDLIHEFIRVLATKDAHQLYEQFGFIKPHRPERWMERPDPNMKESPDYWRQ
jgi:hypothetical protein